MSNCETIMLPILEVESHQIREVLRCILHTVVFNRALGCVRPVDMESDLFDISYVQCGDSYVARSIEEKITACSAWMEKNPGKLVQVMPATPSVAQGGHCLDGKCVWHEGLDTGFQGRREGGRGAQLGLMLR
mmetsp:Transcript_11356/g.32243  ORF Transcript_11356/g.32243 Transcript_11356/m.32243 type:complete len:132 (+) Transcript_11356:702-1097(+)